MKHKLNVKHNRIINFSILGVISVVGLVVFAEETSHYTSYINVQQTYSYYQQGSEEIGYENQKSFDTFINVFTMGGLTNYQTVTQNYINNLDEAARQYYVNDNDSLTSFESNYIVTANNSLQKAFDSTPRSYGFAIGVSIFILGLGITLILLLTLNKVTGKKIKNKKSKKEKK